MLRIVGIAMLLVMALGGCTSTESTDPRAEAAARNGDGGPVGRNIYSPTIDDDEHVRTEWERSVAALERACVTENRHCAEATAARRALQASD